ncbi:MAG: hypothetical protein JNG86_05555 [Verrucomicrobiaceae bacterium]|nr:hypothetical protein [Verrucomicrobiaceae bacterium]
MKTPPDDFEHALQQLRLRELPAHWKQEILTQAEKSARRRFAPPRALAVTLAAAWVLILALHVLTPPAAPAPQARIKPAFTPTSLFALNQHPELILP